LIARDARQRQTVGQESEAGGAAEIRRAWPHFRQESGRHAEEPAQLIVPAPRPQIQQQRARGVRATGGVDAAAGAVPQQPAVEGAAGELPRLGLAAPARVLVQQPADLRRREVWIKYQAGALEQPAFIVVALLAEIGGAAVLPDDGACQRL